MTPANFAGDYQAFIDALEAFFLNCAVGKAGGFRFRDWNDYRGVGQPLITLPSGQLQLAKSYNLAGRTFVRTITKPVAPPAVDYLGNALPQTVVIYSGGAVQSGWSVDCTTGIVSGAAGDSADFEFDFPVRLDTDDMGAQTEESNVGRLGPLVSWNSIPLQEIRL